MRTLFPDEEIISTSDNNTVILTTHRILYEYKEWGRSYNQNINLEHITSTENSTKNNYLLLILSLLAAGAGILVLQQNENGAFLLFGTALVFIILFFATKRNVIVIGSPSTKMLINAQGMQRASVFAFTDKIELAKKTRLELSRLKYV
jgi:cell division protein FtsW (lipid II flippase)